MWVLCLQHKARLMQRCCSGMGEQVIRTRLLKSKVLEYTRKNPRKSWIIVAVLTTLTPNI